MKIIKFLLLALLVSNTVNAQERVFKDANHAYRSICQHCHKDGGVGPDTPRAEFPPADQANRIEMIKNVVRHGQRAMPAFRKTEIDDATLHDLATMLAQGKFK